MDTPAPVLSIVVPVYNEEHCIKRFYDELHGVLKAEGLPYEILFVDDGSIDDSLKVIDELRKNDPGVAAVVLSRNFGHQTALTAGMDLARGEAVITLDADLQHPPQLISRLVAEWRAGAKVVHTIRVETAGASGLKKLTSRLFYKLINFLSPTPIKADAADFRLLDRRALEALKSMKERHRFLRGMIGWLGFKEASVAFKAGQRAAGDSKYTWRKMSHMATDGIVSFSTRPLRIALWMGLLVFMANAAYGCYILYLYFFRHILLQGWATIVLLTMFLGSSQLILLGVVGEYIGRIYEEIKDRPLYIIQELRSDRFPSSPK